VPSGAEALDVGVGDLGTGCVERARAGGSYDSDHEALAARSMTAT
jgi:hypothetical protein